MDPFIIVHVTELLLKCLIFSSIQHDVMGPSSERDLAIDAESGLELFLLKFDADKMNDFSASECLPLLNQLLERHGDFMADFKLRVHFGKLSLRFLPVVLIDMSQHTLEWIE